MDTLLALGPGLLDTLRATSPPETDPAAYDPSQLAAYGALIWSALAFFGMSMIGKPLWGVIGAAVGVVPWLVLNYPTTWGFLVPAGLWYLGWRFGWRTVAGVFLVGMFFVFRVYTGAKANGLEYGLVLPAALFDTFKILLIFGFGTGILRLVLGPRRMDWLVGSGYHGERRRLRDRPERKRVKEWSNRKKERVAKQVKDGEKYQPTHAKGKAGPPDDGTEHLDPSDPRVKDAWEQGQAGPTPDGFTYDPTTEPADVGGGIPTETLVDGVPLSQVAYGDQGKPYRVGGGLHRKLWRDS